MSLASSTRRVYKLKRDELHWRFDKSRAKVQIFGGGFGNGKTAAVCVLKALKVAKDYPGCNILMARSTYPKLNDTLRKEFLKWCPKDWIKSFPMSDTNTCTLVNGSVLNFRYVSQQGKGEESSTSNLLSATYDLIVVDQMEDPEITEKDFDDLLGRLRGGATYVGNDPTMPRNGPRWFVLTCNPTRNWIYRKLVKPLHDLQRTGSKTKDLLVHTRTVDHYIEGEPLCELFEGSTYENADNVGADFIATLEATYRGQMRDRFLHGQWAAYEGLVYPTFDESQHCISYDRMRAYHDRLIRDGYRIEYIEGYDHGLAQQSCHLFGFIDPYGNVCILDGFYAKEQPVELSSAEIKRIRRKHNAHVQRPIFGDPAIFRRGAGDKKTVGRTVASMFSEDGIVMQRGNNDVINGIIKVQSYLALQEFHVSPFSKTGPAPYIYFADTLDFVVSEFGDYYWKKDPNTGDPIDVPRDRNDHAMDTIKYLLSKRPRLSVIIEGFKKEVPKYMKWGEREIEDKAAKPGRHRYVTAA